MLATYPSLIDGLRDRERPCLQKEKNSSRGTTLSIHTQAALTHTHEQAHVYILIHTQKHKEKTKVKECTVNTKACIC